MRTDIPSREIEIDRVVVRQHRVRNFIEAAGGGPVSSRSDGTNVPLTFSLAIRGGHGPEVEIDGDAFAIHGGHDIELHRPVELDVEYRVRGRVDRIFHKTGRSGPLTVVSRHVRILAPNDALAVDIRDRQIVRWRPTHTRSQTPHAALEGRSEGLGGPDGDAGGQDPADRHLSEERRAAASEVGDGAIPEVPLSSSCLDIGDTIGPIIRRGPTAEEISAWASSSRDREPLFHDRRGSKALGFADLVVPGPMQSAFIDDMLRRCLPQWQLCKLSMTFRQSLTAGEDIGIQGVVIDAGKLERTCDLVVANRSSGETTSIGTAVLRAP